MTPNFEMKRRYIRVVNTSTMKRIAKFVQKNAKYEYAVDIEQHAGDNWTVEVLSPDLSIDHNGNVRIKYVQS